MIASITMFEMMFFTDKIPIMMIGESITSQAAGVEPSPAPKLKI
ncbi:hypothetical protein BCH_02150 [Brucella sp. 191011898]|nr:hypothetical protein BCH_02150 [Brucella sp. 191011898]